MKKLKVKALNPYCAFIGNGALKNANSFLEKAEKVLIISSEKVFSLCGEKLLSAISKTVKVFKIFVPDGENAKKESEFIKIVSFLAEKGFNKSDYILALGGGTILDVSSFSASLYMRGINYINVPTTLLCMADACVGGKTGIDFNGGKNLIGTFYQPKAVFCETEFLTLLPEKEISSGMAEIIKCSLVGDKRLFKLLKNEKADYENLIFLSLKLKAKFIKKDEFDKKERKTLNFGHTFGHALESATDFSLSHGEAVFIGIKEEIEYAERLKIFKGKKEEIFSLIDKFCPAKGKIIESEKIKKYLILDKKTQGKGIFVPLIKRIGKTELKTVDTETFCTGIINGRKDISF